jgi:hypothetical protein
VDAYLFPSGAVSIMPIKLPAKVYLGTPEPLPFDTEVLDVFNGNRFF